MPGEESMTHSSIGIFGAYFGDNCVFRQPRIRARTCDLLSFSLSLSLSPHRRRSLAQSCSRLVVSVNSTARKPPPFANSSNRVGFSRSDRRWPRDNNSDNNNDDAHCGGDARSFGGFNKLVTDIMLRIKLEYRVENISFPSPRLGSLEYFILK